MSFFELFKKTKTYASIICEKDEKLNKYNCKMGLDYEANLFKNNKFEYNDQICESQLEDFLRSLDGEPILLSSGKKDWVFLNNDNIEVHSFGNNSEIHIVKKNVVL
jgi:hypothetical protein